MMSANQRANSTDMRKKKEVTRQGKMADYSWEECVCVCLCQTRFLGCCNMFACVHARQCGSVTTLKPLWIKWQLQRIRRPQRKKLNPWTGEQGRAVLAGDATKRGFMTHWYMASIQALAGRNFIDAPLSSKPAVYVAVIGSDRVRWKVYWKQTVSICTCIPSSRWAVAAHIAVKLRKMMKVCALFLPWHWHCNCQAMPDIALLAFLYGLTEFVSYVYFIRGLHRAVIYTVSHSRFMKNMQMFENWKTSH